MKRMIPMLGALAVVAGFLFAAPSAYAVEGYITAINLGGTGVMCEPRVGGSIWPVNGTNAGNARFFYCGTSTAANRGSNVYNSAKGISSLESAVGTLMTNKNVKVYVMDSPLQYATASGNNPQTVWNAQVNNPALSLFTADGDPENAIIVYENVANPAAGYPNVKTNSSTLQAHDTKHEAGHHFDLHMTGTRLSNSTTYKNLYPDDVAYSAANNPNHATQYNTTFKYWWQNRAELFAEEFAIVFGSASARPVDVPTSTYFICTKAFVFGWGRDQAAPSSYAEPHCTPNTP